MLLAAAPSRIASFSRFRDCCVVRHEGSLCCAVPRDIEDLISLLADGGFQRVFLLCRWSTADVGSLPPEWPRGDKALGGFGQLMCSKYIGVAFLHPSL